MSETASPTPTQSEPPARAFRPPIPLTFELEDTRARKPILYIDDPPPAHKLVVKVTNASEASIVFKPVSLETDKGSQEKHPPATEQHHLALTFRPGTLEPTCLQDGLLATKGWYLAHRRNPGEAADPVRGAGTVSLELTYCGEGDRTLAPGESLTWTLPHLCADPRGGARETLVQLTCQNLAGLEGSPRVQRLSVVNHTGARDLPLHAGFVGSDTVFNDGMTLSSLVLRLTNVSPDKRIDFHPEDSEAPTRLLLTFDTGAGQVEWALGTSSQVKAVVPAVVEEPAALATRVRGDLEGESPEWRLTWPVTRDSAPAEPAGAGPDPGPGLEPGECLSLALSGIPSSAPTGQTHLHLRYENIPGYWDGRITLPIRKSPLRARGRPGAKVAGKDKVSPHAAQPLSVTVAKGLSLAPANDDRNPLYLAMQGDLNHALYNNHSNVDGEGRWDGARWNVLSGLRIGVGAGAEKRLALAVDAGIEDEKLTVGDSAFRFDVTNKDVARLELGGRARMNQTSAEVLFVGLGVKHGGLRFVPGERSKFIFGMGGSGDLEKQTTLLTIEDGTGASLPRLGVAGNASIDGTGREQAELKIMADSGKRSWRARVLLDRVAGYRGAGLWIQSSDRSKQPEDDWFVGVGYTGKGFTIGYHAEQPEYHANSRLFVDLAGNVGIGTTKPSAKLEVAGDVRTGNLTVDGSGFGLTFAAEKAKRWHLCVKNGGFNVAETGVKDGRLFVAKGGNVGVGTLAPSAKLHVVGDVVARSIRLEDRGATLKIYWDRAHWIFETNKDAKIHYIEPNSNVWGLHPRST